MEVSSSLQDEDDAVSDLPHTDVVTRWGERRVEGEGSQSTLRRAGAK